MLKPLYIPGVSDQLPKRGNRFSQWLGRTLMRAFRWRIEGEICQNNKVLFVMAPHTSSWDFSVNFCVYLALGLDGSWFIADNYARGIIGHVLKYFGAVKIDRRKNNDVVSQMVDEINQRDKFVLALFPEGTRKPVARWKTGFWHIAKQANMPVQLIAVDFDKRATVFGPVMALSDDMESDINTMRDYFRPVVAKNPECVDWSN